MSAETSTQANDLADRIKRLEEAVVLLSAALKHERVLSARLSEIEEKQVAISAEVTLMGHDQRDWDLLQTALRRADELLNVERSALAEIATIRKTVATTKREIDAHKLRINILNMAKWLTWGVLAILAVALFDQ